jgi:hypothetical protein
MAKFIALDDGNTIINIDQITVFFAHKEEGKGTQIFLVGDDDPIAVADTFEEVCKEIKALLRRQV